MENIDLFRNDLEDPKLITALIPSIVRDNDSTTTYRLVTEFSKQANIRPELNMLFHVKGFFSQQRRGLCQAFYGVSDVEKVESLASISRSVGAIGFSFPTWRYISQRFNDKSLIEHYGFERLQRETDVRDASLPYSNPERDEFGTGFVTDFYEGVYIEYRRAYILFSVKEKGNQSSFLVRNSSYFFGRDRLPHPAYYSFESMDSSDLKNLNHESVDRFFKPVSKVGFEKTDDITKLKDILDSFKTYDYLSSRWLLDRGRDHFVSFLKSALDVQKKKKSDKVPMYLSWIDGDMPPWFPLKTLPVTHELVDKVAQGHVDGLRTARPVLLTGKNGDFPIRPIMK